MLYITAQCNVYTLDHVAGADCLITEKNCILPVISFSDWGPMVDVVGFCFLNLAEDYKPPQDLVDWLAAGPPPIYVGFGSLVCDYLVAVLTLSWF